MCRLFGFRSVLASGVHQSLVGADNALGVQSQHHPDGWGVAYFVADAPQVIKSTHTALQDRLFHRVSGVVSSHCVLAHVRRATQGLHDILNTHPFQHGRWVFAHNGNLKGFAAIAGEIRTHIDPTLSPYILGETDSELIFYLLLSCLAQKGDLHRPQPIEHIVEAIEHCVSTLIRIAGPLCSDDGAEPSNNFLSFVLSDGRCMVTHQGGKALHLSTHKTRCGELSRCPHASPACTTSTVQGKVTHFIVSSEPMAGDNHWSPAPFRAIIGVDRNMRLFRYHWSGSRYVVAS